MGVAPVSAAVRSNGSRRVPKRFLGDSHGRDQVVTGELALDEHGKILGLRVDALHDMGSHVFDASMVVPLFALQAGARRLSDPGGACRRPGGAHQHRRRCSPIAAPDGRRRPI